MTVPYRKKSSVNVRAFWLLFVILVLPFQRSNQDLLQALVDDPSPTADFLAFHRTGPASAEMRTSICRFRHPDSGQLVSLVGAVHIGEKAYYQQIQAELDRHDLVLYELVGGPAPGSPEAKNDAAHQRDDQPSRLGFIQDLQQGMQSILQLQHQMDGIDYTRNNLRHADLDADQFASALAENGLFNINPAALMKGLGPALLDGIGLQAALMSQDENAVNRVRWMMGKMMAESTSQMAMLGVENIEKPEDLILGIRNDQVWKVLQRSLPEGWRRIAIFYGAAHLPDFRRRLLEEGWIFEELKWISAWKIPVNKIENELISVTREARL